jgi:hypothetical protein
MSARVVGRMLMRFAGYAALFDVRDRGGDVVRRGAFAGLAAPIPLLWQHDPARPIGTIDHVAEDARGLRVVGRVNGDGATAKEVAAMLRDGTVGGLSFGYHVRDARTGPIGRAGVRTRELRALDLREISIVTSPMQPGARVIAVARDAVLESR